MKHYLEIFRKKNFKEKMDDVCVLLLTLIIISLPYSIRLNSIAIAVFIIFWIVQNNFSRLNEAIRKNKMLWLNISLYLITAASLLYTHNRPVGMFEMEKEFSLLLFPILFVSIKKISVKRMDFILWSFVIANFILGLIGLLYATYSYYRFQVNYFFYHDLVILFNFHATYFSMYLSFSILAILYLFSKHINYYSRKLKAFMFLLIGFFITLIFLLSVRSIIIFFSLSALIGILVFTIKNRKYKLGFLLFVGFISVIYFGINKNEVLKERLLQIKDNYKYEFSRGDTNIYNGFTTRLAQWECSYNIIKQSPFFGVGIGDVQDELQTQYKKNILNYSFKGRFNAHNQYFQTAIGLGITGLLVFLAGFIVPVVIAMRNKRYIIVGFVILFASCCLTESMLCMQQGVVFFSFFNSLFSFHLLSDSSSGNRSGGAN